jgi:hypothetical protein
VSVSSGKVQGKPSRVSTAPKSIKPMQQIISNETLQAAKDEKAKKNALATGACLTCGKKLVEGLCLVCPF